MAELEVYNSITELDISNTNHKLKVRILKTWRRPIFKNPKQTYSLEFVCADEQVFDFIFKGLPLGDNTLPANEIFTILEQLVAKLPTNSIVLNSPVASIEKSESTYVVKLKNGDGGRRIVVGRRMVTGHRRFSLGRQGYRAQGTCLASFFYRFERFLEDQNVLTIKKPLLGSNGGSWTIINSPLKICFNRESQLALPAQWAGSRHSFSFTNVRMILDCQASRTSSIAGTARHSVSNAFNNSNLFINDSDIEEITTFLHSGSLSVLISKEEDFLNVTDFIYSAQIEDITEPKTVVLLATIKQVNNQWFYMACNHCLRKVESQLEPLEVTEGASGSPREVVTYYCKNQDCLDQKKVILAYPRYMVLLKVQDSTGTVDLTLFDSEAKKIINKPALQEDALAINVPDEIAAFIDKQYVFKIDVTDNHINKRSKSYTIKALTDDEMIITALHEKYFKQEVATNDSDFVSSENISGKEVISICDDNVTPSSAVGNIAKVIADESGSKQLKRNLDDSFENQELLTMSSAKKQSSLSNSEPTSNGEVDGIVDGKLLITKKEK
ncbi:hypothetical protein SSX86_001939 [Deinandra increscens subsp. villosa]|uniref:Replication factor A C-terminal domain-containing protein n=1 Tax=Deinandra increscens subsp. villosa TaxID=3103831 RepID=A0AAP0H9R0_9ASTR